jgi:hypothetical protein
LHFHQLPCSRSCPPWPPQIRLLEPHPWPRSTVTPLVLNELVNDGLLALAGDSLYLAWMVPPASDKKPNPLYDNVFQLRPSARMWFHRPGEPVHAGVVQPLQGGA